MAKRSVKLQREYTRRFDSRQTAYDVIFLALVQADSLSNAT